jgi:hypothetical protein
MLLGGMGDDQRLICGGMGSYSAGIPEENYTIDARIIGQHASFYTLDASIDWQRHIRYVIDTSLKVNCTCGYSIDAVFKLGTPTINNTRSYNVYKVKVPYYD